MLKINLIRKYFLLKYMKFSYFLVVVIVVVLPIFYFYFYFFIYLFHSYVKKFKIKKTILDKY